MEKRFQCDYRNPRTHRQCNDYADAWLALPEGNYVPVCEKHFGSLKTLYETKYGKENIQVHRRLMENADNRSN